MKDKTKKNNKVPGILLFKMFKRRRKSKELVSPPSPSRPTPIANNAPQDEPKTPERLPDHIPREIDTGRESPRSVVSILSLKSAFELAAERSSTLIQFRPPIRGISNLLPSFSEGGESVEKSLLGGFSDRETPTSRQPSSQKILFTSPPSVFPVDTTTTDIPKRKLSSITRTKFFHDIVIEKFKNIDKDGSGSIDKDELYLGVLLVHLELAKYVGASACQPASRQYVDTLFDSLDVDSNGYLDLNEFSNVMIILCSEITSRVLLQWSMNLMIIPFIAHYLVASMSTMYSIARFIHPSFLVPLEAWILELQEVGLRILSLFKLEAISSFVYILLPNTVLITTTILSILLVPWLIGKSEHFFLSLTKNSF